MSTSRERADIAWVFPGQGAQYVGMGRGFAFEDAAVRSVFEEAEASCGRPLRELSVSADARTLRDPAVLEPLLVAFSLAYAERLRERGQRPAAVAGYSAGAISALCCAGVIDRGDAFRIATARGRLLSAAARDCTGAMLAVFGLPGLRLQHLVADASAHRVDIAAWNAPDHLTIVGPDDAVADAARAVEAAGGHVFPVDIAGAWHGRHAEWIVPACADLLADIRFRAPSVPYYCSVSGRRETDPVRLRDHLSRQIRSPVLWRAAIGNLHAGEGIQRFAEVGCGRTLRSMTARAIPTVNGVSPFVNLYGILEYQHAA